MTVVVDIENVSGSEDVPEPSSMRCWASAALGSARNATNNAEIAIRLVDEAESATLNERYRHKSGPTNVLSFPADIPPELKLPLLGDLVICVPVVAKEALEQGKSLNAHWAHMVVHGALHLLGYDHVEDQAAVEMESLETHILTGLGFPPPYEPEEHSGTATSTTP